MKTQAFFARIAALLCAGILALQFGAVAAQTPPTITAVADQIVNEGVATSALAFTVGDAETPVASLTMSGTSSNTTLVPNANIVFGGAGAARTVVVTPVANLSGTATITLTVTDGSSSTAFTTFLLTVDPVNGMPVFSLATNQSIVFTTSSVQTVANFATGIDDGDPDVVQTLAFNVINTNNALFTGGGQPSIDATGTLTYTPSGVYGVATLQVTLTDDATAGGPALTTAVQTRTITITNPAPLLTYNPDNAATAVPRRTVYFFDGVPAPGQTRNSAVAVTPSLGSGTGALSTSVVNSCAITGPDAASFSSVAGVNLSFVGATTTAQNIPLSCTSGATNQSGTLTCNETRGTAAVTQRIWPLNCPSCYLNISETLDTTAPALAPALGVASATGQQTGRINRFAVDSVCGGTKTNPGNFTTTGARQFDSYTITPTTSGCVTVRITTPAGNGTALFLMVASPFVPATPGLNWVADNGSSFPTDGALSFTATAGQSYDVVVHEVNPAGGIGIAYNLQVDTCNVPPASATISIDDVSVNEGNAGTTSATFTVTRSNNTTAFSVPFSTAAGTATAGSDFTTASGTLTFAVGGALTQTITVLVNGDTVFEPNETFTVDLGAITNTTGFTTATKASGTGTIVNDDLPSADLSITKTDGVTSAVPGGSVTYTITASNAGPNNAPGSTVADTFPAALTGTWTCVGAGGGTCTASGSGNISDTVNLPVGGSVTYTVSATISASATGTLSNTATVATAGGIVDPTPGNNSATDTDTLTPQANLSITKTDGVTTVIPGGTVTYTIVASNAGPSNAPGSAVADTLPATLTGAAWTCVGAGGGTCPASGSGNINSVVNLPAGGSVTFTLTATLSPIATGTLSNTATVTAAGGITDPTPGNNSATDTDTIAAQADLSITKTDGVTVATLGGTVTYTIVASNAGPSNAPGSTVTDTLPAGLTGATWTCVGATGGTCTASGSGNISDTVNLPAGGSVTYTLTATVSQSATGTLSNTATVAGPVGVPDPTPGNNSATDTDTLQSLANLAITKTDGVTTATRGGTVTYTIVASNAGPSNAPGSVVADTLPATLTGVTWSCVGAGGGTCTASGSGNINDTVNLPVGGTVTYTVNATVGNTAVGTLSNTATVTAASGITDPTPGNNSATDTDTVFVPTFVVAGAASSGDGTVTCVSPVDFGTTTTCTITAGATSRLVSATGCGGTLVNFSSYVTGPITAACTVTAAFTSTIVPTLQGSLLAALALLLALVGWMSTKRRV